MPYQQNLPQMPLRDPSDESGVSSSERPSIRTTSDGFVHLTSLCQHFGFDYFMLIRTVGGTQLLRRSDIVFSSLPSFAMDQLFEGDSTEALPFMRKLRTRSSLFIHHFIDDPFDGGEHGEAAGLERSLQIALALTHVAVVPLAHCKDQHATALFFSTRAVDETLDRASLVYRAQLVFEQLEDIISEREQDVATIVNQRQLECLSWASLGKTSSEIGLITSLSEHTVNHYLNSCCRSLNCVNRTQAVAKAIRLGLID